MYLFSRSVRPGPGNPEKQLDWAVRITEKVNQISETPVSLWTTVFSPNAGQFVWSSIFEDLVTIETTFEKLIGDKGYASLVEEGGTHVSGDAVDDGLLQFLFVDPKAADIDVEVRGRGPDHGGAGRTRQGHGARGGDGTARRQDHRVRHVVRLGRDRPLRHWSSGSPSTRRSKRCSARATPWRPTPASPRRWTRN